MQDKYCCVIIHKEHHENSGKVKIMLKRKDTCEFNNRPYINSESAILVLMFLYSDTSSGKKKRLI